MYEKIGRSGSWMNIDRLRLRDRARFIHDRMISRDAFPISISWLFTSRYTRERWYLSKNRWSRMKIDRAKTGSENRIASIPPRQVVPLFFFFFFLLPFSSVNYWLDDGREITSILLIRRGWGGMSENCDVVK